LGYKDRVVGILNNLAVLLFALPEEGLYAGPLFDLLSEFCDLVPEPIEVRVAVLAELLEESLTPSKLDLEAGESMQGIVPFVGQL